MDQVLISGLVNAGCMQKAKGGRTCILKSGGAAAEVECLKISLALQRLFDVSLGLIFILFLFFIFITPPPPPNMRGGEARLTQGGVAPTP